MCHIILEVYIDSLMFENDYFLIFERLMIVLGLRFGGG